MSDIRFRYSNYNSNHFMKLKFFISLILLMTTLSFAQEKKAGKPKFNQELATYLGADQYGMKPYTIVMLTTGSVKIEDNVKMGELMKGHLTNIGKLADEGKIIVAGPFLEKNKENYRGMFIFNTKSKEEAEQWVKTDPAVQAGVFSYEIFSWYGSAALPLYLKHHDEITKENP